MQSLEQFYQDVWARRRELTLHEDTTSVPYRLVYERQRSPVSYLRIDLLINRSKNKSVENMPSFFIKIVLNLFLQVFSRRIECIA